MRGVERTFPRNVALVAARTGAFGLASVERSKEVERAQSRSVRYWGSGGEMTIESYF